MEHLFFNYMWFIMNLWLKRYYSSILMVLSNLRDVSLGSDWRAKRSFSSVTVFFRRLFFFVCICGELST